MDGGKVFRRHVREWCGKLYIQVVLTKGAGHVFLAYLQDFESHNDPETAARYALAKTNFPAFIQHNRHMANGINLQPGWVQQTSYWLVSQKQILGVTRVRHTLHPDWGQVAGHIGYEIAPSFRRLGHGTRILQLALEKARAFGLTKIIITCDATNLPSKKIIEKAGGHLLGTIPNPAAKIPKLQFSIPL